MRSIQDITVTSEEVALSSYIEAFKIAQRELEQEHKPELQLTLIQPKSPFKIKKGENFSVEVKAGLSKGEIARQTFAVIAIPEGFELNVREHWTPFGVDRHPGYEGYRSTPARDLLKPTWHGYYADIKCPTDLGKYTFWYWAICEGYATEDLSFQVNVV